MNRHAGKAQLTRRLQTLALTLAAVALIGLPMNAALAGSSSNLDASFTVTSNAQAFFQDQRIRITRTGSSTVEVGIEGPGPPAAPPARIARVIINGQSYPILTVPTLKEKTVNGTTFWVTTISWPVTLPAGSTVEVEFEMKDPDYPGGPKVTASGTV